MISKWELDNIRILADHLMKKDAAAERRKGRRLKHLTGTHMAFSQ